MFKLLRKKIGIIGYGNMGSAIAERIKYKYYVFVFDKDKSKIQNLSGIIISDNIKDFMDKIDVVILAIKPQDFDGVLSEIKNCIVDKLIISIAAGITTKNIENLLGKVRIIRVMPNIEAIIGKSLSYLCRGQFANWNDLKLAIKLFNFIGHSFIYSDESFMNVVTAVGGSSPGFWGYRFNNIPRKDWGKYAKNKFIPEFILGAKKVGFNKKEAELIANGITWASIATVNALRIEPIELTEKVASKGGTTQAGLEKLEKGGSLTDAFEAAVKRAEELSK